MQEDKRTRVLTVQREVVLLADFDARTATQAERGTTSTLRLMYLGPGQALLEAVSISWRHQQRSVEYAQPCFIALRTGEARTVLDEPALMAFSEEGYRFAQAAGLLDMEEARERRVRFTLVSPHGRTHLDLGFGLTRVRRPSDRPDELKFDVALSRVGSTGEHVGW